MKKACDFQKQNNAVVRSYSCQLAPKASHPLKSRARAARPRPKRLYCSMVASGARAPIGVGSCVRLNPDFVRRAPGLAPASTNVESPPGWELGLAYPVRLRWGQWLLPSRKRIAADLRGAVPPKVHSLSTLREARGNHMTKPLQVWTSPKCRDETAMIS